MSDNLSQEVQQQLLHILQKYEHLFDGTLGEFNMDPISLHLTDKGNKPVNARPYNVSKSVEQQLHTEIGVLEEDYTFEWVGYPKHLQLPRRMEQ
jgi:hypothetical protein